MDEKRALSEVYGQCIGIPGRAATYSRCTLSPKAYKMVRGEKELDAMCRCILQEMSDFWDVVAPTFLEVEMMRNRDVEDPLQYVLKSRDFPVLFSEKRSKCVSKFGRRD